MHTFGIIALIQFEPHVFIMRNTVCTYSFVW